MRARLGNLWSWRDHLVPSGRMALPEPVQAWDPPTSNTDASRGRWPVCITRRARRWRELRLHGAKLEIHSLPEGQRPSSRSTRCQEGHATLGTRPRDRGGRGAEEEKKARGLTSATAGHRRRGKVSREMAARVENIVSPESPSRD
jgi:hypothetical protein